MKQSCVHIILQNIIAQILNIKDFINIKDLKGYNSMDFKGFCLTENN